MTDLTTPLLAQVCPKLAVISSGGTGRRDIKVLLCRRTGETDYNDTWSLIGGKVEVGDDDLLDAIERERDEEVGSRFTIAVHVALAVPVLWRKGDGTPMVLPHYLAVHRKGAIILGAEYSEYTWVPLAELNDFGPMVDNIKWIVPRLILAARVTEPADVVEM